MDRKKRVKKGVESLQEQIEKHEKKRDEYTGTDDFIREYWNKEIESLRKRKKNREDKLNKL